jgi:lipopolysaccharide/colanic/teichoic acid biosynthesis glycosyltransferase/multisubunit Na+/H+ antiporter MnhB subunit
MQNAIQGTMGPRKFLARLRYQLLFGLFATVVLPLGLYNLGKSPENWTETSTLYTGVASLAAFLIALYLFRRVMTFPGVGVLGYVMPAVGAGYAVVAISLLAFRIEYSRLTLLIAFLLALGFLFTVASYVRLRGGHRFYIVPGGSTDRLSEIAGIDWVVLSEPEIPHHPGAILVADLRADLAEHWDRLISTMAIKGHPVYHVKQVQESLTGRVEIEHLSENSFGSLLPNLGYRRLKRIFDLLVCIVAVPLLFLPGLIIALAIKLDSPGPVFFRQRRQGYRGEAFTVIKFRTMVSQTKASDDTDLRKAAITVHGDERITSLGRWLRRSRIDELPQVFNVLAGDMSWIGPRPEAMSLSTWYTDELAFYNYRHIVRPGITGWAQVNQGHVAGLDDVLIKLHYDFYYIKNFSAWLDLLIVARTLTIIFSGAGAR